ncbi:MAG: hypothetical protein KKB50_04430 [Planctomycetes bacterium]|nr:hypothetical protein [Planctomycetota bacterium]
MSNPWQRDLADRAAMQFALERLHACPPTARAGWLPWVPELRWDARIQAAWRPGDRAAQSLLYPTESSVRQRLARHLSHLRGGHRLSIPAAHDVADGGLVVFQRDCTVVAVAPGRGVVAKVVRRDARGLPIVARETRAAKLLPEYVPAILEHDAPEHAAAFPFVLAEYAPNENPVTREEWPAVLPGVLEILLTGYERAGFVEESLRPAVERTMAQGQTPGGSAFDLRCRRTIDQIGRACGAAGDPPLLSTTVHGDLTWNNVHRTGNGLKLIDWANGGRRNVFFDLFMQEFYRGEAEFWSELPRARSLEWFERYFFGAFLRFRAGLERLCGRVLSVDEIRAQLVFCLLEMAVENYRRYSAVDEVEGEEFFRHIDMCAAALQSERTVVTVG